MVLSLIESRLFGRICYGYFRRKDGIVETDDAKIKVVQDIFEMYLEGNSLEGIQKISTD